MIGTIQATEAIKLILGAGDSLAGRLLLFDALAMTFRTLKLRRDPDCLDLRRSPDASSTLIDYEQFCGIVAGGAGRAAQAAAARVRDDRRRAQGAASIGSDPIWILDVREPREFEICRIPGSTLIPLGELPKRLDELPQGADAPDIVVHCKMGGRSAKAVGLLREHGFTRVKNLKGGILAWIDKVDPSQSKYLTVDKPHATNTEATGWHGAHGVRRSFFEDLFFRSAYPSEVRVLRAFSVASV